MGFKAIQLGRPKINSLVLTRFQQPSSFSFRLLPLSIHLSHYLPVVFSSSIFPSSKSSRPVERPSLLFSTPRWTKTNNDPYNSRGGTKVIHHSRIGMQFIAELFQPETRRCLVRYLHATSSTIALVYPMQHGGRGRINVLTALYFYASARRISRQPSRNFSTIFDLNFLMSIECRELVEI